MKSRHPTPERPRGMTLARILTIVRIREWTKQTRTAIPQRQNHKLQTLPWMERAPCPRRRRHHSARAPHFEAALTPSSLPQEQIAMVLRFAFGYYPAGTRPPPSLHSNAANHHLPRRSPPPPPPQAQTLRDPLDKRGYSSKNQPHNCPQAHRRRYPPHTTPRQKRHRTQPQLDATKQPRRSGRLRHPSHLRALASRPRARQRGSESLSRAARDGSVTRRTFAPSASRPCAHRHPPPRPRHSRQRPEKQRP